jgi:hypothetical protein
MRQRMRRAARYRQAATDCGVAYRPQRRLRWTAGVSSRGWWFSRADASSGNDLQRLASSHGAVSWRSFERCDVFWTGSSDGDKRAGRAHRKSQQQWCPGYSPMSCSHGARHAEDIIPPPTPIGRSRGCRVKEMFLQMRDQACGFHVNFEREFGRLLDRQVGRLRTLQRQSPNR